MAETDPGELADHLEDEADDLERRSQELEEKTDDVSQDWQRKRSDPSVPGAPEPHEDDDEDEDSPPTGALSGKGDEED
jgi:hypothetical protein